MLGSVEVRRDGEVVPIGGPKPRQILAMLVAARGGVVSTDRLHEELWGDDQPADPGAVLQSQHLPTAQAPPSRCPHRRPTGRVHAGDRPVGGRRLEVRGRPRRCPCGRSSGRRGRGRTSERWTASPARRTRSSPIATGRGPMCSGSRRCAPSPGRSCCRPGSRSARTARSWPISRRSCRSIRSASGPGTSSPSRCTAADVPPDALRRIAAFRSILRDELGLDPPAAIRQLEARILESDPTLLGTRAPVAGPRLASPAGRGHAARRPQRRPRRHRSPPRGAPARHARRPGRRRARHAWRCESRPTSGTTAAARCTSWSWRRCTTRSRRSPRWRPPSTCSSASTSASRRSLVEYLRGRQRAARPRQLRTPPRCRRPPRRTHARGVPRPHRAGHQSGGARAARASTCGGSSRSPWPTGSDAVRRAGERARHPDVRRAGRGVEPGLLARPRQRGRRRRDRRTSRRSAPGHRAGGGSFERHQPGRARRATAGTLRAPRPCTGRSLRAASDPHTSWSPGRSTCSTAASRSCSAGSRCSPARSVSMRSRRSAPTSRSTRRRRPGCSPPSSTSRWCS